MNARIVSLSIFAGFLILSLISSAYGLANSKRPHEMAGLDELSSRCATLEKELGSALLKLGFCATVFLLVVFDSCHPR